jgi:hypothetical protein
VTTLLRGLAGAAVVAAAVVACGRQPPAMPARARGDRATGQVASLWTSIGHPLQPPLVAGRPLRSTQYHSYTVNTPRLQQFLTPIFSPASAALRSDDGPPPAGLLTATAATLELPDPANARVIVKLTADPGSTGRAGLFSGVTTVGARRVLAEYTPSSGLHAVVFDGCQPAWYLEPYSESGRTLYVAYVPEQTDGVAQDMACRLAVPPDAGDAAPVTFPLRWAAPERTLRIVVSATDDYINGRGGVDGAVGAIQSSVHRVNAVLRSEFGITLSLDDAAERTVLVNGAGTLTSTDPQALARQNDAALAAAHIAGGSYDLAHVLFTGSGGYGEIGSVCTARRAVGASGGRNRTGDPFDIDVLTHEIGHQLGGRHTNNMDGYSDKAAAYEPASGSTIMGYPGLFPGANLQKNADPYFHGDSLRRIETAVRQRCGAAAATANKAPTIDGIDAPASVNVGQDFVLTALGHDDDGDDVLYTWEEFDRGPQVDAKTRPLFRSWCPQISGRREIGARRAPLANDLVAGEELPPMPRILRFVVTARDGKGGVAQSLATVRVDTTLAAMLFRRP